MTSKIKKFSQEWWASLPPERVGKETEKLVEDMFVKMNSSQRFAYHRLPDAKAARGMLKAQPADFSYRNGNHAGYIEVKALKHPYRLPFDRLSQLPILKKWSLAGSDDIILIHHYMIGLWRVALPQELSGNVTSWDLSKHQGYDSAVDALQSTGWFD